MEEWSEANARRSATRRKSRMPTFDVILPAYNAEQYLSRAIDSVVAQTFTDWRILLVDDGSRDSTPEIAAGYATQLGDKLKYIRQDNAGLAAARNTAIRHATAEFLALLDADDLWCKKPMSVSRQCPKLGLPTVLWPVSTPRTTSSMFLKRAIAMRKGASRRTFTCVRWIFAARP